MSMTLPEGYSLPRSCVHSECRKSCKKQCPRSFGSSWWILAHWMDISEACFFCTFSQRPQCAHAPIVHSVHGLKHTLWLPSFPVFLTQPVLSGIVCLHFLWCRGSGPGLCWANALPRDCTPTLALTNFSHHSCVYLVWRECSHTGATRSAWEVRGQLVNWLSFHPVDPGRWTWAARLRSRWLWWLDYLSSFLTFCWRTCSCCCLKT